MPDAQRDEKVPLIRVAIYIGLSLILFSVYTTWPMVLQQFDLELSTERSTFLKQLAGAFFWLLVARSATLILKRFLWQGVIQRRMASAPPNLLVQLTNAVIWLVALIVVASAVFDRASDSVRPIPSMASSMAVNES